MAVDMDVMLGERTSVFSEKRAEKYARYAVEITFDKWLMGGVPRDPKLIEGWIRAKAGVTDQEEKLRMMRRTLIELGVELPEAATFEQMVDASAAFAEEHHTNGFKVNGDGPYIESRQVKACIKESTAICFPYPANKWGPTKKASKGYISEVVTVEPAEISLGKPEPDGIHLWIGHPKGPQGRTSNLTYVEYSERPTLAFEIEVYEDAITWDQWAEIWTQAERQGIGALRSQGFGTFKCVAFELRSPVTKKG